MDTKIIVVSGHMIDRFDRISPRFPIERLDDVREDIRRSIQRHASKNNKLVAVGSAACGCDLIFHEEVLDAGGDVILVLPYKEEDFLTTALDPYKGGWAEKFKKIKSLASKIKSVAKRSYFVRNCKSYTNALLES